MDTSKIREEIQDTLQILKKQIFLPNNTNFPHFQSMQDPKQRGHRPNQQKLQLKSNKDKILITLTRPKSSALMTTNSFRFREPATSRPPVPITHSNRSNPTLLSSPHFKSPRQELFPNQSSPAPIPRAPKDQHKKRAETESKMEFFLYFPPFFLRLCGAAAMRE